jgi:hypothetical protein
MFVPNGWVVDMGFLVGWILKGYFEATRKSKGLGRKGKRIIVLSELFLEFKFRDLYIYSKQSRYGDTVSEMISWLPTARGVPDMQVRPREKARIVPFEVLPCEYG